MPPRHAKTGRAQPPPRASAPAGMKLLNMWVADPNAPGFREEAERQAASLRNSHDEKAALSFIEAAAAWPEEPYDWGPGGPPGRSGVNDEGGSIPR